MQGVICLPDALGTSSSGSSPQSLANCGSDGGAHALDSVQSEIGENANRYKHNSANAALDGFLTSRT